MNDQSVSPCRLSALLGFVGMSVLLASCAIPRDVPVTSSAASKSALMTRYADMQSRLNKLNAQGKLGAGVAGDAPAVVGAKYDWAKAQCWVRNSYSERHENDAAGFPAKALDEAERIIKGLESGNNTYKQTALINHTEPVRKDLWRKADALKQHAGYACAAQTAACLEVQLSRSGHELAANGWRNSNPYLAIAEDMAAKAQTEADACVVKAVPRVEVAPVVSAPAPAAKTIERVSLNASALFKFDKRTQGDMLPEGKRQLDELAERINRVYASVDSILLIGYTDRLGSDAYNDKLSLDRANTVKAYLQSKGLAASMSTQGKGKADPVVQCEGNKATAQLTACLQPNRRVELTIVGVKR